MLSYVNLALQLGNKNLFSGVSFTLLPGSIYLLKGANGSGKTSLLKAMAGLHQDLDGDILWNNKPIDNEFFYNKIISYLGHENAIKNELSVIDNLLLWADLKNTHLLLAPAIAQFRLNDYVDTKCKHLSAGWQRRVALARMVISNSKLWLLDEPETNLDEFGLEILLKLLQVKISNGGMVFIASPRAEYYKKIPTINIHDFKYA